MKKKHIELTTFDVVNTLIMILIGIVMIYPFWNTVAVSLNDAQDSLRGGITFWPRVYSTYSYVSIFRNKLMLTAAVNSVLRTLIATVLGVFINSIIAFVLSRQELVGRKFITIYFLITMYISAGLIPTYFLMKQLHLLNSFWVYIFPTLVNVFNVIVIKSFMQGLPESLTEAAIVDGAGYFRTYAQIVMPLSKPVLATVALWCAVGAWNSWFDTFLYNSSNESLTTLQYEMMKLLSSAMNQGRDITSQGNTGNVMANTVTPTSMRAAVTVIASVPILVVYPFLQKYFIKGVTLGAVKG